MSLVISAAVVEGVAVLRCKGRVTLGEGSPMLRDDVRKALTDGAKDVVLDMTQVSYMDSSGIGELVSAYTVTRNSGGDLVLAGVGKKVKDLLQITKLYTVFRVFGTAEEAVRALRGGGGDGVSDE